MKATVKFGESGDPYSIKVSESYGHSVTFSMDGSTAVALTVEPPEGEPEAWVEQLSRFMDYVETLPFVQASTLQDYESPGDSQ